MATLSLLLRLALRDLRGGLRGFGIFLACIALGVASIVGVGSTARSLAGGLQSQGRTILGGDVAFGLIHRQLSAAEAEYLGQQGGVASVALLRAMARRVDGEPALVEIKAVDAAYPSAGAVDLDPPGPLAVALAQRDGVFGIVAEPALMARLDLKPGDTLLIGDTPLQLRAVLASEPDKLAGGVGFGPRVLMSQQALAVTGLIQPGSLARWVYRLALADPARIDAVIAGANAAFPQAGWEVRTRDNVSPQFGKNLDRFAQFLTLVGLTALIVGGVGIANAVGNLVESKRATIAILKSAGATGFFVFGLMLLETLLVALAGIAAGLVGGAALPFAAKSLFGALIPFPMQPEIFPGELAAGCLYGLLATLSFALLPLGRAHDVPATALFRDQAGVEPGRLRRIYLALLLLAAAGLVASILLLASNPRLAGIYMLAVAGGALALRLVAIGLMALARRLPRPASPPWRLAIANIHRPGALTPAIVLSLGLGLALLVALAAIDGNIRRELDRSATGSAPSFFFVDIQSAQAPAFNAFLAQKAGNAKLEEVPMMRGRLVKLGDTPAEAVKAREDVAWVLEGDRGITFAAALPQGSQLKQGAWWAKDYSGPPLVSLEAEVAAGLGLRIGDRITVNVLGRDIEATVANLRTVNWRSIGINFVMIFSPSTFAGAPHSLLATLTFPGDSAPAQEFALLRDVARVWPSVTSVRVKDTLAAIAAIVAQLALAIRGASAVALLSAVLVLAGALASGQRARLHDAVVLKVLGITRGGLFAAYVIEYGLLGAATALFAMLTGMAAAWAVTVHVMKLEFAWLWPDALLAATLALMVTILLGLAGTWSILGRRPAEALRNLG